MTSLSAPSARRTLATTPRGGDPNANRAILDETVRLPPGSPGKQPSRPSTAGSVRSADVFSGEGANLSGAVPTHVPGNTPRRPLSGRAPLQQLRTDLQIDVESDSSRARSSLSNPGAGFKSEAATEPFPSSGRHSGQLTPRKLSARRDQPQSPTSRPGSARKAGKEPSSPRHTTYRSSQPLSPTSKSGRAGPTVSGSQQSADKAHEDGAGASGASLGDSSQTTTAAPIADSPPHARMPKPGVVRTCTKLLNEATVCRQYGEYAHALRLYQHVHCLRPDGLHTYYLMGSCYMELKEYAQAAYMFNLQRERYREYKTFPEMGTPAWDRTPFQALVPLAMVVWEQMMCYDKLGLPVYAEQQAQLLTRLLTHQSSDGRRTTTLAAVAWRHMSLRYRRIGWVRHALSCLEEAIYCTNAEIVSHLDSLRNSESSLDLEKNPMNAMDLPIASRPITPDISTAAGLSPSPLPSRTTPVSLSLNHHNSSDSSGGVPEFASPSPGSQDRLSRARRYTPNLLFQLAQDTVTVDGVLRLAADLVIASRLALRLNILEKAALYAKAVIDIPEAAVLILGDRAGDGDDDMHSDISDQSLSSSPKTESPVTRFRESPVKAQHRPELSRQGSRPASRDGSPILTELELIDLKQKAKLVLVSIALHIPAAPTAAESATMAASAGPISAGKPMGSESPDLPNLIPGVDDPSGDLRSRADSRPFTGSKPGQEMPNPYADAAVLLESVLTTQTISASTRASALYTLGNLLLLQGQVPAAVDAFRASTLANNANKHGIPEGYRNEFSHCDIRLTVERYQYRTALRIEAKRAALHATAAKVEREMMDIASAAAVPGSEMSWGQASGTSNTGSARPNSARTIDSSASIGSGAKTSGVSSSSEGMVYGASDLVFDDRIDAYFPHALSQPVLYKFLEMYNELLLRYGPDERVFWYRANIYKILGNTEACCRDLSRVHDMNPEFVAAYIASPTVDDAFDNKLVAWLQWRLVFPLYQLHLLKSFSGTSAIQSRKHGTVPPSASCVTGILFSPFSTLPTASPSADPGDTRVPLSPKSKAQHGLPNYSKADPQERITFTESLLSVPHGAQLVNQQLLFYYSIVAQPHNRLPCEDGLHSQLCIADLHRQLSPSPQHDAILSGELDRLLVATSSSSRLLITYALLRLRSLDLAAVRAVCSTGLRQISDARNVLADASTLGPEQVEVYSSLFCEAYSSRGQRLVTTHGASSPEAAAVDAASGRADVLAMSDPVVTHALQCTERVCLTHINLPFTGMGARYAPVALNSQLLGGMGVNVLAFRSAGGPDASAVRLSSAALPVVHTYSSANVTTESPKDVEEVICNIAEAQLQGRELPNAEGETRAAGGNRRRVPNQLNRVQTSRTGNSSNSAEDSISGVTNSFAAMYTYSHIPFQAVNTGEEILENSAMFVAWTLRHEAAMFLALSAYTYFLSGEFDKFFLLIHRTLCVEPSNAVAHAALLYYHMRFSPLSLVVAQLETLLRVNPLFSPGMDLNRLPILNYPLAMADDSSRLPLLSRVVTHQPSLMSSVVSALGRALASSPEDAQLFGGLGSGTEIDASNSNPTASKGPSDPSDRGRSPNTPTNTAGASSASHTFAVPPSLLTPAHVVAPAVLPQAPEIEAYLLFHPIDYAIATGQYRSTELGFVRTSPPDYGLLQQTDGAQVQQDKEAQKSTARPGYDPLPSLGDVRFPFVLPDYSRPGLYSQLDEKGNVVEPPVELFHHPTLSDIIPSIHSQDQLQDIKDIKSPELLAATTPNVPDFGTVSSASFSVYSSSAGTSLAASSLLDEGKAAHSEDTLRSLSRLSGNSRSLRIEVDNLDDITLPIPQEFETEPLPTGFPDQNTVFYNRFAFTQCTMSSELRTVPNMYANESFNVHYTLRNQTEASSTSTDTGSGQMNRAPKAPNTSSVAQALAQNRVASGAGEMVIRARRIVPLDYATSDKSTYLLAYPSSLSSTARLSASVSIGYRSLLRATIYDQLMLPGVLSINAAQPNGPFAMLPWILHAQDALSSGDSNDQAESSGSRSQAANAGTGLDNITGPHTSAAESPALIATRKLWMDALEAGIPRINAAVSLAYYECGRIVAKAPSVITSPTYPVPGLEYNPTTGFATSLQISPSMLAKSSLRGTHSEADDLTPSIRHTLRLQPVSIGTDQTGPSSQETNQHTKDFLNKSAAGATAFAAAAEVTGANDAFHSRFSTLAGVGEVGVELTSDVLLRSVIVVSATPLKTWSANQWYTEGYRRFCLGDIGGVLACFKKCLSLQPGFFPHLNENLTMLEGFRTGGYGSVNKAEDLLQKRKATERALAAAASAVASSSSGAGRRGSTLSTGGPQLKLGSQLQLQLQMQLQYQTQMQSTQTSANMEEKMAKLASSVSIAPETVTAAAAAVSAAADQQPDPADALSQVLPPAQASHMLSLLFGRACASSDIMQMDELSFADLSLAITYSTTSDFYWRRALLLLRRGQRRAALGDISLAIKSVREDREWSQQRLQSVGSRNESDNAIAAVLMAKLQVYLLARTVLLFQLHEYGRSIASATEAIKLVGKGKASNALRLRSLAHTALGAFDAAKTDLEAYCATCPYDLGAQLRLAYVGAAAGQFDFAHDCLRKLLRIAPRYPLLHFIRGLVYFREGAWAKAINSFNACLTVQPSFLEARMRLWEAQEQLGHHALAIQTIGPLVSTYPLMGKLYCGLGRQLLQLAQISKVAREMALGSGNGSGLGGYGSSEWTANSTVPPDGTVSFNDMIAIAEYVADYTAARTPFVSPVRIMADSELSSVASMAGVTTPMVASSDLSPFSALRAPTFAISSLLLKSEFPPTGQQNAPIPSRTVHLSSPRSARFQFSPRALHTQDDAAGEANEASGATVGGNGGSVPGLPEDRVPTIRYSAPGPNYTGGHQYIPPSLAAAASPELMNIVSDGVAGDRLSPEYIRSCMIQAIQAFKMAILCDPLDAEALYLLAYTVLFCTRQSTRGDRLADTLLSRSLAIEPANVSARLLLALIHMRHSQLDSALLHINEALRLDPDQPEALALRAHIQLARGDVVRASQAYERLLQNSLRHVARRITLHSEASTIANMLQQQLNNNFAELTPEQLVQHQKLLKHIQLLQQREERSRRLEGKSGSGADTDGGEHDRQSIQAQPASVLEQALARGLRSPFRPNSIVYRALRKIHLQMGVFTQLDAASLLNSVRPAALAGPQAIALSLLHASRTGGSPMTPTKSPTSPEMSSGASPTSIQGSEADGGVNTPRAAGAPSPQARQSRNRSNFSFNNASSPMSPMHPGSPLFANLPSTNIASARVALTSSLNLQPNPGGVLRQTRPPLISGLLARAPELIPTHALLSEAIEGAVTGYVPPSLLEDLAERHYDTLRATAYANRGLVEMIRGNPRAALTDLDNAVSIKPNLASAVVYRAECKVALGAVEDAAIDYRRATELVRKEVEAVESDARDVAIAMQGVPSRESILAQPWWTTDSGSAQAQQLAPPRTASLLALFAARPPLSVGPQGNPEGFEVLAPDSLMSHVFLSTNGSTPYYSTDEDLLSLASWCTMGLPASAFAFVAQSGTIPYRGTLSKLLSDSAQVAATAEKYITNHGLDISGFDLLQLKLNTAQASGKRSSGKPASLTPLTPQTTATTLSQIVTVASGDPSLAFPFSIDSSPMRSLDYGALAQLPTATAALLTHSINPLAPITLAALDPTSGATVLFGLTQPHPSPLASSRPRTRGADEPSSADTQSSTSPWQSNRSLLGATSGGRPRSAARSVAVQSPTLQLITPGEVTPENPARPFLHSPLPSHLTSGQSRLPLSGLELAVLRIASAASSTQSHLRADNPAQFESNTVLPGRAPPMLKLDLGIVYPTVPKTPAAAHPSVYNDTSTQDSSRPSTRASSIPHGSDYQSFKIITSPPSEAGSRQDNIDDKIPMSLPYSVSKIGTHSCIVGSVDSVEPGAWYSPIAEHTEARGTGMSLTRKRFLALALCGSEFALAPLSYTQPQVQALLTREACSATGAPAPPPLLSGLGTLDSAHAIMMALSMPFGSNPLFALPIDDGGDLTLLTELPPELDTLPPYAQFRAFFPDRVQCPVALPCSINYVGLDRFIQCEPRREGWRTGLLLTPWLKLSAAHIWSGYAHLPSVKHLFAALKPSELPPLPRQLNQMYFGSSAYGEGLPPAGPSGLTRIDLALLQNSLGVILYHAYRRTLMRDRIFVNGIGAFDGIGAAALQSQGGPSNQLMAKGETHRKSRVSSEGTSAGAASALSSTPGGALAEDILHCFRAAHAHNNIGLVLLEHSTDPTAPLVQLEMSVTRLPTHVPARVNLGIALERVGQLGRAIEQYRIATALAPLSTIACFNLANAEAARGFYSDSVQLYGRLLRRYLRLTHFPTLAAAFGKTGGFGRSATQSRIVREATAGDLVQGESKLTSKARTGRRALASADSPIPDDVAEDIDDGEGSNTNRAACAQRTGTGVWNPRMGVQYGKLPDPLKPIDPFVPLPWLANMPKFMLELDANEIRRKRRIAKLIRAARSEGIAGLEAAEEEDDSEDEEMRKLAQNQNNESDTPNQYQDKYDGWGAKALHVYMHVYRSFQEMEVHRHILHDQQVLKRYSLAGGEGGYGDERRSYSRAEWRGETPNAEMDPKSEMLRSEGSSLSKFSSMETLSTPNSRRLSSNQTSYDSIVLSNPMFSQMFTQSASSSVMPPMTGSTPSAQPTAHGSGGATSGRGLTIQTRVSAVAGTRVLSIGISRSLTDSVGIETHFAAPGLSRRESATNRGFERERQAPERERDRFDPSNPDSEGEGIVSNHRIEKTVGELIASRSGHGRSLNPGQAAAAIAAAASGAPASALASLVGPVDISPQEIQDEMEVLHSLIPLILMNRAVCLHRQGRIQQAASGYDEALEYAPKNAMIRFNRAHLSLERGHVREALVDLNAVLRFTNSAYLKDLLVYTRRVEAGLRVAARDVASALSVLPLARLVGDVALATATLAAMDNFITDHSRLESTTSVREALSAALMVAKLIEESASLEASLTEALFGAGTVKSVSLIDPLVRGYSESALRTVGGPMTKSLVGRNMRYRRRIPPIPPTTFDPFKLSDIHSFELSTVNSLLNELGLMFASKSDVKIVDKPMADPVGLHQQAKLTQYGSDLVMSKENGTVLGTLAPSLEEAVLALPRSLQKSMLGQPSTLSDMKREKMDSSKDGGVEQGTPFTSWRAAIDKLPDMRYGPSVAYIQSRSIADTNPVMQCIAVFMRSALVLMIQGDYGYALAVLNSAAKLYPLLSSFPRPWLPYTSLCWRVETVIALWRVGLLVALRRLGTAIAILTGRVASLTTMPRQVALGVAESEATTIQLHQAGRELLARKIFERIWSTSPGHDAFGAELRSPKPTVFSNLSGFSVSQQQSYGMGDKPARGSFPRSHPSGRSRLSRENEAPVPTPTFDALTRTPDRERRLRALMEKIAPEDSSNPLLLERAACVVLFIMWVIKQPYEVVMQILLHTPPVAKHAENNSHDPASLSLEKQPRVTAAAKSSGTHLAGDVSLDDESLLKLDPLEVLASTSQFATVDSSILGSSYQTVDEDEALLLPGLNLDRDVDVSRAFMQFLAWQANASGNQLDSNQQRRHADTAQDTSMRPAPRSILSSYEDTLPATADAEIIRLVRRNSLSHATVQPQDADLLLSWHSGSRLGASHQDALTGMRRVLVRKHPTDPALTFTLGPNVSEVFDRSPQLAALRTATDNIWPEQQSALRASGEVRLFDSFLLNYIGALHQAQGNLQDATESYSLAILLDHTNVFPRANRAVLARRSGRYTMALLDARALLTLFCKHQSFQEQAKEKLVLFQSKLRGLLQAEAQNSSYQPESTNAGLAASQFSTTSRHVALVSGLHFTRDPEVTAMLKSVLDYHVKEDDTELKLLVRRLLSVLATYMSVLSGKPQLTWRQLPQIQGRLAECLARLEQSLLVRKLQASPALILNERHDQPHTHLTDTKTQDGDSVSVASQDTAPATIRPASDHVSTFANQLTEQPTSAPSPTIRPSLPQPQPKGESTTVDAIRQHFAQLDKLSHAYLQMVQSSATKSRRL